MKRLPFSLFLTILITGLPDPAAAEPAGTAAPVKFLRNREVALGLYPEGFRSAAVLTGSGLSLGEDDFPLFGRLVYLLANHGIRGTFFFFPGDGPRGALAKNPNRVELLTRLTSHNFGIAQDGIPPGDDSTTEPESGGQADSSARRLVRIGKGRDLFSSLGLEPAGYRGTASPEVVSFLAGLEDMGYLYFCIADDRSAAAPAGFSGRGGEVLFPRSVSGLRILRFTPGVDPSLDPERARREFEEISGRGGIFIYQVDLPGLRDQGRLANLKTFIAYLKGENSWLCSLEQISRWWVARREITIETSREDDTLLVVYDNPTGFPLKNAGLFFGETAEPFRYYRVEDRKGMMAASGIRPAGGFINVTFPAGGEGDGNER